MGVTLDKSFILPSKYMDRHSTYVAMTRHRESVNVYYSKDKFRDYNEMVKILGRENRKDLVSDYYLSKDYQENTQIFARNKNIIAEQEINTKKPSHLKHFANNSIVFNFAKELQKTFNYSFVSFEAGYRELSNYIGSIDIEGKTFSILEKLGIGGYLLKNTGSNNLSFGDEVRVIHKINESDIETTKLSKKSDSNYDINDNSKDQYEIVKERSSINKIARGMRSKEYYSIDNNITTKDIYAALYDKLPALLGEFCFERKGDYYVSTTGHKSDGSDGKKGKVYVYQNNPGLLVDYTRGNKSIWDYVAHISGVKENKVIFEYLANAAGLKSYFNNKCGILTNHKAMQEDAHDYNKLSENIINKRIAKEISTSQKNIIASDIWQKIYDYSLEKINVSNNQVLRYLKEERKYSEETIKACGIGYIPNKKELMKYMANAGLSSQQIQELQSSLGCIGYVHKMIMPFNDKDGNLMGLVGRNIKYDEDSKFGKYFYSKGLERSSTMVGIENIDKNKPLIIVEGILDALHAKAVNMTNVVALGGSGMNIRQLDLLENTGIKEVNLCLDNDKAGREATKNIALQIHDRNPDIVIKEVKMPENIKDLDQLITDKNVAKFDLCIKEANKINVYALSEARELKLMDKFKKEYDGYEYEITFRQK
jgi:hypothetical protein